MLRLKKEELVLLLYHLTIMKKPFKKGIKKKHNREEVKAYVNTYQSIINKLKDNENEQDVYDIQLVHDEVELLQTFLPWYIKELEKGLAEEEKERLGKGINGLKTICNMLVAG